MKIGRTYLYLYGLTTLCKNTAGVVSVVPVCALPLLLLASVCHKFTYTIRMRLKWWPDVFGDIRVVNREKRSLFSYLPIAHARCIDSALSWNPIPCKIIRGLAFGLSAEALMAAHTG